VPVLARVEGEGALDLHIVGNEIDRLSLTIFEPPRLFEKFLEGRSYCDVPDMVARICGICPVAYQMSAVHAIEQIFGMEPGPWVRDMRRLFYCGEWLESHALHVHLLAAPDFLGFASAIAMAEKFPNEVRRGLQLQELGNAIVRLLGGRSVHPVGARVGGFSHAPRVEEVQALLVKLRAAVPDAEALVRWVAAIPVPDDPQEFTYVSMRHPDEYPMNEGRLVSSRGLDIGIKSYRERFTEFHVDHSTALHSTLDGEPYLVGPLARLNLNLDRLPEPVLRNLATTGVRFPSANMFHSALARAVEAHFALLEAIKLLERYRPEPPHMAVTPRAGVGFGCTEAPRGILWHRYELDGEGRIVSAEIVPPTAQNQARIEADLRRSLVHFGLEHEEKQLRLHAETVIRNYDPCISCSTHFLRLRVERD
jgi:coenzyme F420-reducing hydrogenase alpha subunit